MAVSPDSLDLPRPFGPYTLVRRLAVGGMAEVYVAKARGIGGFEKLVAIKLIHPRYSEDEHFVRMLVEEAKISVLLTHVNVAQIYDLGCIDDTYFIVMEYIEGADTYRLLRRLSEQKEPLPVEVGAFIASEVCNGLDYAHRKRDSNGEPLHIVHRDISPQNVLLSFAGEVKLVDFGIAKAALRTAQTEAGVIKGKYYYMSPEQAWGDKMDHRSDVFSTGIVLYEMLTGEMLYKDDNLPQLLDRVRKADVAPPSRRRSDVPKELDAIVTKALAKRPQDRWQSARDFGQALSQFLYRAAPTFTSARLADTMMRVFPEEHKRHTGSVRLPSERPPPAQPTAAGGEEPGAIDPMRPDEFAPNPQSVIFDLGAQEQSDDLTRRDVPRYRAPAKQPAAQAGAARAAAVGRHPDESTTSVQAPVRGRRPGGDSEPPTDPARPDVLQQVARSEVATDRYEDRSTAVVAGEDEMEAEPTVVQDGLDPGEEDDWDDPTRVFGEEESWDDATLVDDDGDIERRARELSANEQATTGPWPPGIPASSGPAAESTATAPWNAVRPEGPNQQTAGGEPAAVSWPPPPPKPATAPGPAGSHGAQGQPPGTVAAPGPAAPSPQGRAPSAPASGGEGMAPPGVPAASPATADPRQRISTKGYASAVRAQARRRLLLWLLVPVAIALLFAMGVGLAAAFRASKGPPQPVLKVLSVPRGAQVKLDGRDVGATPVEIREGLQAGQSYRLEVLRPGFEPWASQVTAQEGSLQQNVVLSPQRATVKVTTEPSGAQVWVDGVLSGKSPLELENRPIDTELHIRTSLEGHEDATRTVRVTADDLEPVVHLELEPG